MASSAVTDAAVNSPDVRFTGNHTIVQWAHDVLTALGLPTSVTNIGIMVTWANIESGGYNPNLSGGRNNPLNTTQPGHGGVGGGGQGNIMDYPSYADGVAAIVENLRNPRFGYPAILAGLRAQNPAQTFNAINASSFGTHIPSNQALNFNGSPGKNPATDTPSGGAQPNAQLTSATDLLGGVVAGALGPVGPLLGLVPGGGALKAVDTMAGLVVNAFLNWRYIGEFLIGLGLVTIGVLIIVNDVGTKKAPQIIGTVAKVAAA